MPGISPDQRPAERVEWGRKRRLLAWLNVVLMSLFLLGSLVVVNLLSRKKFFRKDLTHEKSFELSSNTLEVLRNLDRDVTIYLVPASTNPMYYDPSLNNAWKRIGTLVDEYKKISARLTFVEVSDANKQATAELKRHFDPISGNAIYFVAPAEGGRVNKRELIVRAPDFYDGNQQTGLIDNFYGEHRITAGIQFVTFSKKRVVYATVGHKELEPNNGQQHGLAILKHFLDERENVEIKPLSLAVEREVPPDADAVLIAGPTEPFLPKEVDGLRNYLERGGSLFVGLMIKTQTNLEPFLQEWGVKVGDNFVLDYVATFDGNPLHLSVTHFGAHDINRGMTNTMFTLRLTCTVEPVEKPNSRLEIQPLMFTDPSSWEEKGPINQVNPKRDPDERGGPLSAAVAVKAKLTAPKPGGRESSRLVVWGSATSIANMNLSTFGYLSQTNLEYILNNFRWLFEKEESITIPGRHSGRKPPDISPDARVRLRYVTIFGFPMLGVILGFLAWLFRRK